MTTRTTNALGFLAAALLFLSMFAGLFGALGSTAAAQEGPAVRGVYETTKGPR